jgi:hypothetical protein
MFRAARLWTRKRRQSCRRPPINGLRYCLLSHRVAVICILVRYNYCNPC